MKIDSFSVSLNFYFDSLEDEDGNLTSDSILILEATVWVNGKAINPSRDTPIISLTNLYASQFLQGEFFILNCSCGEPLCAGISDGVEISEKDDQIKWKFSNEYKKHLKSYGFGPNDKGNVIFRFDRESYLTEVRRTMNLVEALVRSEIQFTFNESELNDSPKFKEQLGLHHEFLSDGHKGHTKYLTLD